jgi:hypothetical protein
MVLVKGVLAKGGEEDGGNSNLNATALPVGVLVGGILVVDKG